ncbi:uncharacterized protein LOC131294615 [Anopheles ziemanni]|uniref:uncharacterized protein LOC131265221 n=1 Tax=Anopheles coustani TaxID=139045 RepID=UPI002658DCB3|nr:uncharacterized protein LOC131265221 [Anopheles coustani]XP_058178644.1 uncharacterized protein LOC131294615 [Anopheles ziemanni]
MWNRKKLSSCIEQLNTALILAATLFLHVHPKSALEIEHPHSFSVFKRGVMLGDVSYSYSSTDMGSPESGRYKTVTVIKNIAVPKPTSTMFSDRSEHFYDTIEKSSTAGHGHKKRTHVEYWPPKEDNQVSHHQHTSSLQKPELERHKTSSNTHPPSHNGSKYRGRPQTTPSHKPPAIKEHVQEEPKHPVELLELAKSAVETLNQKAKIGGTNTGPVTFPADATKMKKKINGIVSVAKEYTSILTTDPKDRQPIASKLRTKVDLPTKAPTMQPTSTSSEEIPLKELEQSEYVFNHRTGAFEFKKASKAPKAVQEYLRAGPYGGYKIQPTSSKEETDEPSMGQDDTNTYSSPAELLFAELRNAVATRNVTMIKSLASQLEETFDVGKMDFESLKMEDMDRRPTAEPTMMVMMMETTTGRPPFDFGYGSETTTMDYQEAATEAAVASTTIRATTTIPTTTKKPLRYIAPKLRGFKRFSSKRQSN